MIFCYAADGTVFGVIFTYALLVAAIDKAFVFVGGVGKRAEFASRRILFWIAEVCVVTQFVAASTDCVKVLVKEGGSSVSDAVYNDSFFGQFDGL